jgi:hypothetical protein
MHSDSRSIARTLIYKIASVNNTNSALHRKARAMLLIFAETIEDKEYAVRQILHSRRLFLEEQTMRQRAWQQHPRRPKINWWDGETFGFDPVRREYVEVGRVS